MAILNPARDLSPRIFTAIAGWGSASFAPIHGHYWWVAGILGPHIGAVIGGWLYLLSIDHSNLRLVKHHHQHRHHHHDHEIGTEKTELRAVAADGSMLPDKEPLDPTDVTVSGVGAGAGAQLPVKQAS